MAPLIVIAGAPGSGKSTVIKRLHQHFQSVLIEFSDFRVLHLDPEWHKASPSEEAMSFENLVFALRNYLKHGYSHILLTDLEDERVQQIPSLFKPQEFMIVTLVLSDEAEHKRRVLDPDRDSGYRDYQKAIAWNKAIMDRQPVTNEYRLDTTNLSSEAVSQRIIDLIAAHRANVDHAVSDPLPLLRRVDCVRFFVPNLEAGLAFYRDKLGHTLIWRTQFAAGLRMPDCDAEIVLQTEDQRQETDITVESADEAAEYIVSAGGKVVVPPFDIQIGRCVVVEDPFGNPLVLLDTSKGLLITDASGNIIGNAPPN